MPGRWTQYDTDEYRLPEGMKRIGYDADSRRYTFQDHKGVVYRSEPGNAYGNLVPAEKAAEASIQNARPNAFESPDPAKRRSSQTVNTNLNSFQEFLPSEAITTSPTSSDSLDTNSTPRRMGTILQRAKTMRTAISRMSNHNRTEHGDQTEKSEHNNNTTSPSSYKESRTTATTAPRTRQRHRGYTQLADNKTRDSEQPPPYSPGGLSHSTPLNRSNTDSSNRTSSQPRPSHRSSRASRASTSTVSTITPT